MKAGGHFRGRGGHGHAVTAAVTSVGRIRWVSCAGPADLRELRGCFCRPVHHLFPGEVVHWSTRLRPARQLKVTGQNRPEPGRCKRCRQLRPSVACAIAVPPPRSLLFGACPVRTVLPLLSAVCLCVAGAAAQASPLEGPAEVRYRGSLSPAGRDGTGAPVKKFDVYSLAAGTGWLSLNSLPACWHSGWRQVVCSYCGTWPSAGKCPGRGNRPGTVNSHLQGGVAGGL